MMKVESLETHGASKVARLGLCVSPIARLKILHDFSSYIKGLNHRQSKRPEIKITYKLSSPINSVQLKVGPIVMRHFVKALYTFYVIATLVVLLNSVAQPAYAYVDPGSGLLLLQILGSTIAGMSFFLRKKILSLIKYFGKSSTTGGDHIAGL
jgi:hypothetical protein